MKIGEKKNLIREKMERNVIKILSKKRCKRCVTLPLNSLQRGITLPFWCSFSLMTLSSEGLRIFSLFRAHYRTKNIFLIIIIVFKFGPKVHKTCSQR